MHVLQLPPNASCNKRVNLLSRYGINFRLSTKLLMHLDNASNDLLIFAPSRIPDLLQTTLPFSDPAKSIKLSLPIRT